MRIQRTVRERAHKATLLYYCRDMREGILKMGLKSLLHRLRMKTKTVLRVMTLLPLYFLAVLCVEQQTSASTFSAADLAYRPSKPRTYRCSSGSCVSKTLRSAYQDRKECRRVNAIIKRAGKQVEVLRFSSSQPMIEDRHRSLQPDIPGCQMTLRAMSSSLSDQSRRQTNSKSKTRLREHIPSPETKCGVRESISMVLNSASVPSWIPNDM